MTGSGPASRREADLRLPRIPRTILARAAATGLIVGLAGLIGTYRLMPLWPWIGSAAGGAAVLSLALRHPLRRSASLVGLAWLATGALVLSLAATLATGDLHSVNLPVDLLTFTVAAALYPPRLPVGLGALNALLLALPAVLAGRLGTDWRSMVEVGGAFVAAGFYGPVAHIAITRDLRRHRRLEASVEIGRALATLDLEAILPVVAAQVGRFLDALEVCVLVTAAGPAERRAGWTAPDAGAPRGDDDLAGVARRAVAERAPLVAGAGRRPALAPGDWRPDSTLGARLPAVRGLAVLITQGEQILGAIAVAAGPGQALLPGEADALQELAGYAALGVRAALLHEESRRQALIDPITRLYNARYLSVRLEEEVSRARRHRQPLSLLFLDSDSLKMVNDRFGHASGDRLVRSLAQAISRQVRTEDIPVRYAGGDEFIVILPDTDWPEAVELAERLRHHTRALPVGPHGEVAGTVSVGIATFPIHAATAEELIARADQAMYAAKAAGKDCVAVYGSPPLPRPEACTG